MYVGYSWERLELCKHRKCDFNRIDRSINISRSVCFIVICLCFNMVYACAFVICSCSFKK